MSRHAEASPKWRVGQRVLVRLTRRNGGLDWRTVLKVGRKWVYYAGQHSARVCDDQRFDKTTGEHWIWNGGNGSRVYSSALEYVTRRHLEKLQRAASSALSQYGVGGQLTQSTCILVLDELGVDKPTLPNAPVDEGEVSQ